MYVTLKWQQINFTTAQLWDNKMSIIIIYFKTRLRKNQATFDFKTRGFHFPQFHHPLN